MKMNRQKYLIISILTVLVMVGVWTGANKAENINLFEQQKIVSHMLVNMFLQKIDEEELTVFNHVVKKSDLVPHHVSYVHDLTNDELKAELCFVLTKEILVPEFEGYFVERIVVEMDKDGSIVGISTHVSPSGQEQQEELLQDQITH